MWIVLKKNDLTSTSFWLEDVFNIDDAEHNSKKGRCLHYIIANDKGEKRQKTGFFLPLLLRMILIMILIIETTEESKGKYL
jgi:hypothetical protein